jgi:hypothetical protein
MKPTKVELLVAANAEATNKYFEGIELLLEHLLDKFSSLESWKTTMDSSLGSLLQTTSETAGQFRSWRRDHHCHHRCHLPRLPCFNRDRSSMVTRIVNSLYLLFKINNYILINILSY